MHSNPRPTRWAGRNPVVHTKFSSFGGFGKARGSAGREGPDAGGTPRPLRTSPVSCREEPAPSQPLLPTLPLPPNSKQAPPIGRHRGESIPGGPRVTRPERQPTPLGLLRIRGTPPPLRHTDSPPSIAGKEASPPQNQPARRPSVPQNTASPGPPTAGSPHAGRRLPRPRRARRPSPLCRRRRARQPRAGEGARRSPAPRHSHSHSHLHPPRPPPPRLASPPGSAARRPSAHSACFAPAAPTAEALPPPLYPVGSGSCLPRRRSKTPLTKGWSPSGGGHPQPGGDEGAARGAAGSPQPPRCRC
ncbi:translation initiation factor IF-2-like [Myiozetetes cayanensis]|uniref:translation initiation factor IF-2-like n=1 Tax=Myiozetetes cayanensis TaxID=478635 RepID=UPI00215EE808|nr:translation initiation factor IF-2-like [Myiozetetes cayanensis]